MPAICNSWGWHSIKTTMSTSIDSQAYSTFDVINKSHPKTMRGCSVCVHLFLTQETLEQWQKKILTMCTGQCLSYNAINKKPKQWPQLAFKLIASYMLAVATNISNHIHKHTHTNTHTHITSPHKSTTHKSSYTNTPQLTHQPLRKHHFLFVTLHSIKQRMNKQWWNYNGEN